uniref:Uncharacterized protein n=1 Tax=Strombidinopsis acuminata TaxID=141414 RepID=A0A7S3T216_9SPIT
MAEMPEIERKYALECSEYASVMFGVSDELSASSRLETEQLAKLADVGKLQAQLDCGELVAIEGGKAVSSADLSACIEDLDSSMGKTVDVVMATKLPALEKKK